MIQKCERYLCDVIPTEEDIKEALEIVKSQNIIIELCWQEPYTGFHRAFIAYNSTMESVKAQMSGVYASNTFNT